MRHSLQCSKWFQNRLSWDLGVKKVQNVIINELIALMKEVYNMYVLYYVVFSTYIYLHKEGKQEE